MWSAGNITKNKASTTVGESAEEIFKLQEIMLQCYTGAKIILSG